jgi:hypothetical protein
MEVGEHWAYGTSDTPFWFLEARIIRIDGNQAVVAFIDEDGVEGGRFRKPIRNLRCRWEDQWEFLQEARIRKADSEAEFDAVEFVFQHLIGWDIATAAGSRSNDVHVYAPDEFTAVTGIPIDVVDAGDLDCYYVARLTAERHSDKLLQHLDAEECGDFYSALRKAVERQYDWSYMVDPKDANNRIADEAGRLTQRRNSVLRTWAGEASVDRARENKKLRRDLLQTGIVARRAIDALANESRTVRAERLVIELRAGLPLSVQDVQETALGDT